MYKYIFLVVLILFTGCSYKTSTLDGHVNEKYNNKEEAISSREYKDISKDAILEAAKKVFTLAGKKEFRVDSYRNKLIASRTKMVYIPLYPITHEDFWELNIEEKDNISNAKLLIYRVSDFDTEKTEYLDSEDSDIFWNRIDYLLGLTDTWKSCTKYIDFSGTLCDSVDLAKYRQATKEDRVKDILIVDRANSKNLNEIDNDILKDDIELSIEDAPEDVLAKEDDIDATVDESTDDINDKLDKEIEELDKKVNENIDTTLDKIKEEVNEALDSIE